MLSKKSTTGIEAAGRGKLVPPLALLMSQISCPKSQPRRCLPRRCSVASWTAVQEFAPGISYEAEVAVRPRLKLDCGEEEPFGDRLRGLGSFLVLTPSTGREAERTDRRTGRQWVGSTWQNGAFVLSQSRTGRGPFNELFWSGQPAETIFTLMLRLMAKPASKPAAAKGGREAAACTRGDRRRRHGERGGWSKRTSRERRRLLPSPTSPAKGTDLLLSPPFAFVGFFSPSISPSPAPQPLWQHAQLELFSWGAGSPQVCPPPCERHRAANAAVGGALSGTKHSNCLTI